MKAWHWLLAVLTLATMAYGVWPLRAGDRPHAISTACRSNLKQIATATLMYTADYDGRMPHRDRWMDDLSPYIKREGVFICPVVGKMGPGKYGYCFNRRLSLAPIPARPEKVATFFDSINLARNASGNLLSLPDPPRHPGASARDLVSFVAFADGHVQMVQGP